MKVCDRDRKFAVQIYVFARIAVYDEYGESEKQHHEYKRKLPPSRAARAKVVQHEPIIEARLACYTSVALATIVPVWAVCLVRASDAPRIVFELPEGDQLPRAARHTEALARSSYFASGAIIAFWAWCAALLKSFW